MKRILYLIVGLLVFASCSKEPSNVILGSWKVDNERIYEHETQWEYDRTPENLIYTFEKDGVGARDSEPFTYSVTGDKLSIQYRPTQKPEESILTVLSRDSIEMKTDLYFSNRLVYTRTLFLSRRK